MRQRLTGEEAISGLTAAGDPLLLFHLSLTLKANELRECLRMDTDVMQCNTGIEPKRD